MLSLGALLHDKQQEVVVDAEEARKELGEKMRQLGQQCATTVRNGRGGGKGMAWVASTILIHSDVPTTTTTSPLPYQLKSDLAEAVGSAVDHSTTHIEAYQSSVMAYTTTATTIAQPTKLTPQKRDYPHPETFR